MIEQTSTVIGFIGIGVMGNSMAGHFLTAGYSVIVYTRTKGKADTLLNRGAGWASTPKEVAEKANVIFTMVGNPTDVEEVYLGENGLITNGKEHTYLIDMTTSKPSLAVKLQLEGSKKGIHVLDAPVSGGDIGAKEGRLSIMVGGELEDFQSVEPLFQIIGTNIVYQGKAGSGQHTKMCNQITIASNMIGVCEALVYAKKAGLNLESVLKSISSGAAGSWSLSNLGPRIISGDFAPGFYIKHFIKDMNIALEEAEMMGINTPGLSLARRLYGQLAEQGEEYNGTQALYKYFNE